MRIKTDFLFLMFKISFENDCLALMGGKILLCRGSAQKIGRTAGNSS